jgi:hypothetical protein
LARERIKTAALTARGSRQRGNSVELKELIMSVEHMPDERLAHFYENIRQQVEADRANKHQFTAHPTVRQYADRLRSEMIKRRLKHSPIEWPA